MKKILESAWNIIRDPASNSQVALAIAVIVAAALLGGVVTFAYGISARTCTGFRCPVAGGIVALISAAASFSAGGLLGLLFGAPSVGASPPGQAGGSAGAAASQPGGIRPNTSLERIADWLTTMIVGLGLVNLSVIWEKTSEASVWLTREIAADPRTMNGTPGIAIALSFSFAGFLLMYLWSLRFLPSELRQSYQLQAIANALSKINKKLLNFRVPPEALDRQIDAMKAEGVDAATLADVRRLYESATSADYDAAKDFGPNADQGYALSVKLSEIGGGYWSFVATLSSPPGSAGKAFWLLHNTFSPEVVSTCPIKPGGTTYENTANEPFWIGVVVPRANAPAIRLGFDLSKAEGASDKFLNAGAAGSSAP